MRVLAVALALVLAGCLTGPEPDPPGGGAGPGGETPPSGVAFRTLDRGAWSGVKGPHEALYTDEAAFAAFWSEHAPDRELPSVDFGNLSVVAVILGLREDMCFGVRVENVTLATSGLATVRVVDERSAPGVACFAAQEDPFHVVALDARPTDAVFVYRQEEQGGAGFRTLAHGTWSGVHEATREVLRDEAAWRAFWDAHASIRTPREAMPEVDFAREHVLVVHEGDKPDTCWSVEIVSVEEKEEALRVKVSTRGPGPDEACGDAITQPHHVVAFPATNGRKPLVVGGA